MRKLLTLAVVLTAVGATTAAQAQNYVVNGRAASANEAFQLAAHGIPAGHWSVNGFGITATATRAVAKQPAGGPKCWYVLDVKLCD